jgi:TusA-related sulfurtransferase
MDEHPMNTSTTSNTVTIDCRGMQCPTPILQIAATARRHAAKPIAFDVLATDQDFPSDLEAW